MPIKVRRNTAGNCVNFVGTTNPTHWNACLSAEVDATDTDRINVINDIRTVEEGITVYEFFKILYTDFVDGDGNAFASAADCAAYITATCNVAGNTGTFEFGPADTLDVAYNAQNTGLLMDTGDAFVLGAVRAVANDDGKVDLRAHSGSKVIYRNIVHTNISLEGNTLAGTVTEVVDDLNAFLLGEINLFSPPDLSQLVTTVDVIGDDYFTWTANLDPAAPVATEFTYENLPATLFPSQASRGVLQGSLAAGSYPVIVRAFNSFGFDETTITFVAAAPTPFDNTKSVLMEANYWLETDTAQGSVLDPVLGGASPWSVSFYIRPGTNGDRWQNIVVFGQALPEQSRVNIVYSGNKDHVRLRIGEADDNFIEMRTANNTLTANTWHHVLVTYDGAGVANGDWRVYVDGTLLTLTVQDLEGTPTLPTVDQLRVGRCINNEDPLRGSIVDELAIWNSDQSGNIALIRNSGVPFDLTTLGAPPSHWWRMGDGDTFPTISDDAGGTAVNLTFVNATAAAIVTEVP